MLMTEATRDGDRRHRLVQWEGTRAAAMAMRAGDSAEPLIAWLLLCCRCVVVSLCPAALISIRWLISALSSYWWLAPSQGERTIPAPLSRDTRTLCIKTNSASKGEGSLFLNGASFVLASDELLLSFGFTIKKVYFMEISYQLLSLSNQHRFPIRTS